MTSKTCSVLLGLVLFSCATQEVDTAAPACEVASLGESTTLPASTASVRDLGISVWRVTEDNSNDVIVQGISTEGRIIEDFLFTPVLDDDQEVKSLTIMDSLRDNYFTIGDTFEIGHTPTLAELAGLQALAADAPLWTSDGEGVDPKPVASGRRKTNFWRCLDKLGMAIGVCGASAVSCMGAVTAPSPATWAACGITALSCRSAIMSYIQCKNSVAIMDPAMPNSVAECPGVPKTR